MAERTSDRWISMVQSVLLHGAVVGLLVYGWWTYKQHPTPPAAQTLAIEAVALDSNAFDAPNTAQHPPQPKPVPPPEPEPEVETGPPSPTPEEIAQHEAEERKAAEQQKAQKQQAAEEKRQAEEKRATEQRAAAE